MLPCTCEMQAQVGWEDWLFAHSITSALGDRLFSDSVSLLRCAKLFAHLTGWLMALHCRSDNRNRRLYEHA